MLSRRSHSRGQESPVLGGVRVLMLYHDLTLRLLAYKCNWENSDVDYRRTKCFAPHVKCKLFPRAPLRIFRIKTCGIV